MAFHPDESHTALVTQRQTCIIAWRRIMNWRDIDIAICRMTASWQPLSARLLMVCSVSLWSVCLSVCTCLPWPRHWWHWESHLPAAHDLLHGPNPLKLHEYASWASASEQSGKEQYSVSSGFTPETETRENRHSNTDRRTDTPTRTHTHTHTHTDGYMTDRHIACVEILYTARGQGAPITIGVPLPIWNMLGLPVSMGVA